LGIISKNNDEDFNFAEGDKLQYKFEQDGVSLSETGVIKFNGNAFCVEYGDLEIMLSTIISYGYYHAIVGHIHE